MTILTKRTLGHLLLFVLTAIAVRDAAAQKLYNARRDKVMQETKKTFEELTAADSDIFEQAIKNVDTTNDDDIEQMRARNLTLLSSVATTLPFMTWGELQKLLLDARRQALGITTTSDVVAADLSGELASTKKEVGTLQKEIDAYDKLYGKEKPTLDEIQKRLRDAIENGHAADWTDIPGKAEQWTGDFENLRDLVVRIQPQGLKRLILESELLRIQNEVQRLSLRQEHRKARFTALQRYADELSAYTGTYNEAADCSSPKIPEDWLKFGIFSKLLQTICDPSHQPTAAITADLQVLARRAGDVSPQGVSANKKLVNELANLIRVMSVLGTARYNLFAESMRLSRDELVYHIRVTKLNVREHEILLHAGMTGLAAYESGGIKPADIANIVSSAQALATAAIAARIK